VVLCPGRVVGAICPPVMAKIVLLMKKQANFSPRFAAWNALLNPMAPRSPSPW
jgi:hypothetical protein